MSSDFSGRTPKPLNDPIKDIILNDGFFPDLELLVFQERYRIRSAYRSETIRQQMTLAALFINKNLIRRKQEWVLELLSKHTGFSAARVSEVFNDYDLTQYKLIDVPCLQMGDSHEYTEWYLTAVFSLAKANLMRVFDSMNRADRNDNDDDEEDLQHFVNDSQLALHQLLGTCEVRGSLH